ncbi:MAG: hypothetical protein AAB493_02620 [Patescibacteria group bacterium]
MNEFNKIEWSLLEYNEKERNNDWFWALGIIVVAVSITSIIFGNYFFAVLIVLSGVLIVVFAIKKPDLVSYELNEKGLKIKNRLFPYEKIKSFWVQKETKPTLFIKSERLIMPIISMPIEYFLADEIKNKMLKNKVKEEEMKEHISEKIMEFIDF